METVEKWEFKTFLSLVKLKALKGITNKEWKKKLKEISDETVVRLFKSPRKMIDAEEKIVEELLLKRMSKWPIEKIIKSLSGRKTYIVAMDALESSLWRKLMKGTEKTVLHLQKLIEKTKNHTAMRILKGMNKNLEEIDKERAKVGLQPFLL